MVSNDAAPEFSRIVDIRHIDGQPVELSATDAECVALSRRFGLVSIAYLKATLRLTRDGPAVWAKGTLAAHIVQSCAVSAEDLPATIQEAVSLRFTPDDNATGTPDDEIELDDADCDDIPFSGGRIELGEAISQSLALSIDPFAVGPEAENVRKSGLLSGENASPFAALAALKPKD